MRTFPGMHVNQSGSRGSLTQFRVRGAEANHLLVMIDGVPANAVGDGEYNFADIPLDDIERIELLRGPQSGLYGANAHSGVLTIVTKSGRGLASPSSTRASRAARSARPKAPRPRARRGSARSTAPITASYATTNGFNIARDGSETDGAKRSAVTGQGRHRPHAELQRRGLRAPLPPQGRNSTRRIRSSSIPAWWKTRPAIPPTSPRRWRASKARSSCSTSAGSSRRNGPARGRTSSALENFAQSSASLGTAETLSYKSALLLDSHVRGRREASPHRAGREPARAILASTASSCSGRTSMRRATATRAPRTGVGGEYVLDLLRDRHDDLGRRAAGLQRAVQGRTHLALLAVAEGRADRRTAARERRARRHQPELHRAVRLPHQHLRAESQSGAGKLDRLGCRLGADASGTAASSST